MWAIPEVVGRVRVETRARLRHHRQACIRMNLNLLIRVPIVLVHRMRPKCCMGRARNG